eukprot:scaffold44974_cov176-Amphora_coffeaeformis.AAC.3
MPCPQGTNQMHSILPCDDEKDCTIMGPSCYRDQVVCGADNCKFKLWVDEAEWLASSLSNTFSSAVCGNNSGSARASSVSSLSKCLEAKVIVAIGDFIWSQSGVDIHSSISGEPEQSMQ